MLAFIVLACLLSGCPLIRNYTRFGDADPEADRAVMNQWQDAPPPVGKVRVLIDTLPEGLSIDGGLHNESGFTHQIIGKFSLFDSAAFGLPIEKLLLEARKLGSLVDGDLILGSYWGSLGPAVAVGFVGVVIKADPKSTGTNPLKRGHDGGSPFAQADQTSRPRAERRP